jgi:hypothetical protein
MSGAGSSAFSPRTVLALLLFGAITFFAALYFIGSGQTGQDLESGDAHAAGRGLNGYRALADVLEARGSDVSISRNRARLQDEALLVLSPSPYADGEDVFETISNRRYYGPTLVILPKWYAMPVPQYIDPNAKDGWVVLAGAGSPRWLGDIEGLGEVKLTIDDGEKDDEPRSWEGFGMSGKLPSPLAVQSIEGENLVPLIKSEDGKVLAAYWNDNGYYPGLADQAGVQPGGRDPSPIVATPNVVAVAPPDDTYYDDDGYYIDDDYYADESYADESYADNESYYDNDRWPVVFVAEPDLLNNYGLADRTRGMAALSLIDMTMEDYDLPIVFDLTLNGLGTSENLLTLAFRPPFLAATLCLIIALIVIGWRAFQRFGPPIAESRPIAFGKQQLVMNGARMIQRVRRFHLLGPPYADLMTRRIAKQLGIRHSADIAHLEAEVERVLATRKIEAPPYSQAASTLRDARGPGELLRAAATLKKIERKLAK